MIDKWEVKKNIEEEKVVLGDEHAGEIKIKDVDHYEYLGCVIAADGSNLRNVKKRVAKGYGILKDIREILERTYIVIGVASNEWICMMYDIVRKGASDPPFKRSPLQIRPFDFIPPF